MASIHKMEVSGLYKRCRFSYCGMCDYLTAGKSTLHPLQLPSDQAEEGEMSAIEP